MTNDKDSIQDDALLRVLPELDNGFEAPVFTGMSVPVFPDMSVGLSLTEIDMRTAKLAIRKYDGLICMVMRKPQPSSQDDHHRCPLEFHDIGTIGRIISHDQDGPKSLHVAIQAESRVRLLAMWSVKGNAIVGKMQPFPDRMPTTPAEWEETRVKAHCLLDMVRAFVLSRHAIPIEEAGRQLDLLQSLPLEKLSDYVAPILQAEPDDLQAILATLSVRERIDKAIYLFRKDMVAFEMKEKIVETVTARIEKNNRTAILNEQLREIKKELGNDLDSTEGDLEKVEAKLATLDSALNQEAKDRIREEMDKMRSTPRQSPDYTIIKNYLSWLLDLPWNITTKDQLDVKAAKSVLDRDHFGLADVKKRILEFIGVARLKGSVDGSILCFIGPPGVGKTSLGRSIAEALGRKFFRFSLGGMRDEAEIKGHRRTYIGAQPGKIASAMKVCGSQNPVIMLDEIDKLAPATTSGDPAAALLEVLDPEQNNSFRDHFLDIPFDLSKVLFIATANNRDAIPQPLLDRMEPITLPGYIMDEKLDIAKRHLIPKLLPRNGLHKGDISFSDSVLRSIVLGYARDAGVRSLENAIKGCMRAVAVKIADGSVLAGSRIPVRAKDLKEYLGKELYHDEPLVSHPLPGVVTGLAWTALGGTTLYIEALPMQGEPGLKITGQLGDVMKESAQIAMSVVEKNAARYGVAEDFFKSNKLHIHAPAGATPKDGPSAGITMTSAIISGATGRILPPRWAMTGEITLSSRVLPVGGIREKMLAAYRAGVRNVILPKENEEDYQEVPENVRKEMTAHFVSHYDEVYSLIFPSKREENTHHRSTP